MSRLFFIISLIMILAIPGLIGPPAEAVERCVVVELMTWVNCPGCPHAEAALNSLSAEYPDSSLAIIRYHPSSSPTNPFKTTGYRDRWDFYGRPNFPTAYFDGGMMIEAADDSVYYEYKPRIEARLAVPSPLEINAIVFYDSLSRTGTAIAQVTALDPLGSGDLHLRWVLVESGLEHGGEEYEQVFRALLPDSAGLDVTISLGETVQFMVPFAVDSLWIPENCNLVVFVQNDATKEVLQSAQRLYPSWAPPQPIPAAVEDLKIMLSGSQLYLFWSPVTEDLFGDPLTVDYYRLYGESNLDVRVRPKALLDSTQNVYYLDSACGHVGDLSLNCSFYVTAMSGALESAPSNVVGEIDKSTWRVK